MRDGSLATLEDVVDFHSGGGRPNPSLDPLGAVWYSSMEKYATRADKFMTSPAGRKG